VSNIIVGFSGLPNAGKDEAALYLIESYGYKRLSVAAPIRELVYTTFKLDHTRMGNREYESAPLPELGGHTVKVALQVVGAAFTGIYDAVWVNASFGAADTQAALVVSDVRRPCEANRIHSLGGVCVYIHSNRPLPSDGRPMNHESESYHNYLQVHADYHILNTGSLLEYHQQLDKLMATIKEIT
jgi:hypothetical protein